MEQKNNSSNEYLKTKVMTASSEELQLMLYDGAIRFCEQARVAIRDKNLEQSYHLLTRAENIVMEMCQALRDEYAPETCANMRALYLFCYEQLVTANIKRETSFIDDALKILRHMRETWVLLMEQLKEEKAQEDDLQPADSAPSPEKSAQSQFEDQMGMLVGSMISVEG